MTLEPTMTIEEVRKILRISKNGIYDAVERGEIPTIRIGRVLRVPRKAFEAMLEGAAQ
jgi:excisionase family DNA binding protein